MFDGIKKLLGLKEKIRCSKCKRLNDADDIYCIYCGNKLTNPKKIRSDTTTKKCPKCGNHNPEDSIFCEECGTKLNKEIQHKEHEEQIKREQERQRKIKQQQEQERRINNLGGTNYIKQQLKTKNANQIATELNIPITFLNNYCKNHNTTIDKLINEIQEEERRERSYKALEEYNRKQEELRKKALESIQGYGRH